MAVVNARTFTRDRLPLGPQRALASQSSEQPAPAAPPVAIRRGSAVRLTGTLGDEPAPKTKLTPCWQYLPLAVLSAVAFNVGSMRGAIPPQAIACFLLSLGALCTIPLRNRAELRSAPARRAAPSLLAAAIISLATFGSGMVLWSFWGGLPVTEALAAMVAVSVVAIAQFRRQGSVALWAQIALWLPLVSLAQPPAGLACFAFAGLISVLLTRAQARLDEEESLSAQARERAQTRARDILADYEETGQGWFWETDRHSRLTYISAPVAEMLGSAQDELVGRPLGEIFALDHGQEGERTMMFHISSRSAFQELAIRPATASQERWWSVSGRPIYDQFDNFVGFRGSGTDLTDRRRNQEKASRLALYDSLTGLANRYHMSQSLEKILALPQEMHRCCAVLLLDLDRFKQVNDTRGHPTGDALLKQVAQRLQRTVGELGQVGRLGGDEFQVVLAGRPEPRELGDLANQIIHALSQPYFINGHSAVIGASVGIARAPEDGTTSEELIRNADLALYAAKDGGRGRYHFYAEGLHSKAESRAEIEKDLRDAIVQGDLHLFYQPVVSTATEQISGFEALLRWKHPKKGWISPDNFIGIAEDSGLITQIGEWALRTACRDLATWPEEIRCAVNVSPLQFASKELPAIVTSAIANAGISPSRLELEITESVFLNDDVGTDAMFAALKRVGVRLALDDFGTGYSSLGYLKKAPFDKIKIDRSFVSGATQPGSRNGAIIAAITSLAQTLGMDTTAEGVETLDELDLVRMHGCTHVQGYIYDKPLDLSAASERLGTGLAAVAKGPRCSRAPRQTMLRKVLLDHHGTIYKGTIRNLSETGALVEGVWDVAVGTILQVQLSKHNAVTATVRWSAGNQMGLQFATPLRRDSSGSIEAIQEQAARKRRPLMAARRIGVIHEDYRYEASLYDLTKVGARIEGLLEVPVGTELILDLGEGQLVPSRVRRSQDATQEVDFEAPLISDGAGSAAETSRADSGNGPSGRFVQVAAKEAASRTPGTVS